MGMECSANYHKNIKKMLNSAQRAVLFPITPLFDIATKSLTPAFKNALTRIFRILDSDLTGHLSDAALHNLQ